MNLDKYRRKLGRRGSNVGEVYANNTIAFIESTFSDSPTFRVLEVNSEEFPDIKTIDARVVEVERMGSLREVLFRPYQGLNIGSYVRFDNETWLIFDQWGDKDSRKYVAMVQKCNRTLKWAISNDWKDSRGNIDLTKIREVNCIASQSPLGSKASQGKHEIEWNKFDVSLPQGQLYVFVEKNQLTDTLLMNQRFIFGKNVYEIFGIDDTSFVNKEGNGIIQLMIKLDVKRDADDFPNRIATSNDVETNVPTIPVEEPDTGDTGEGGNPW